MSNKVVSTYLASCGPEQRRSLEPLAANLTDLLPHADISLKYGGPCWSVRNKGVAGFAAFTHHCSYLPHSGSVLNQVELLPPGASVTKGALRFELGSRLKKPLLRQLIRLRLDEISNVTTGRRIDFYNDGQVKAEGTMAKGQPHGKWSWYRQDGSLMRSGEFHNGEVTGTWTTYASDGRVVKVTSR